MMLKSIFTIKYIQWNKELDKTSVRHNNVIISNEIYKYEMYNLTCVSALGAAI